MNRRRFIRLFNKSGVGDSCIAPANTVAPVVSGDLQKGDTLTTTNGTWTGTAPLIYTYQWKRNGVSIPAAVSNTHVIVDADLGQDIQCQVTANSPCGASPLSVLSNTVVPIAPFGGNFTWWADINFAVFSDSGGIDYVDSVPLTGIADSLEQPTAANRPKYIASELDGNAVMRADTSNMKVYKGIDASVFDGGVGTFAFVGKLNSGNTFFTEANADASVYNFQIYVVGTGLRVYADGDGWQVVDASFTVGQFDLHHFTLDTTTLKYYKNGTLISTITISCNQDTSRPLTSFNYKSINAEQGYGDMADIAVLTGTALDATAIANDRTNFWKVKYPSLP